MTVSLKSNARMATFGTNMAAPRSLFANADIVKPQKDPISELNKRGR